MNVEGREVPYPSDKGEFLPEVEFESGADGFLWVVGFALSAWLVIFCSG